MKDAPTITLDEGEPRSRYVAALEGGEATLTFSTPDAGTMVIEHVGTPPALRGRGIGEALVAHAVAEAREHGIAIVPRCPFAAAKIEANPEWRDVLAREGRP